MRLATCAAVTVVLACASEPTEPAPPAAGLVGIAVLTAGSSLHPDSFAVRVEPVAGFALAAGDTAWLDVLEDGFWTVDLAGLSNNCLLEGEPSRRVAVARGVEFVVTFRMACESRLVDQIVFVTFGSLRDSLVAVNPDGTGPAVIETGAARMATPEVSPDGRLIALSNRVDGNDGDIWIVNVEGQVVARVTDDGDLDPHKEFHPTWSPDGTRLAFDRWNGGIVVADVSGPGLLTIADPALLPAWSPAQEVIAYSTPTDLWLVAPDGSNARLLAADLGLILNDGNPSWSPDGERIAYAASPLSGIGHGDLFVIGAAGGDPVRLTDDEFTDASPSWSPDGSRIAFASDREGVYAIYVMNVDGSGTRKLTERAGREASPSWSPATRD